MIYIYNRTLKTIIWEKEKICSLFLSLISNARKMELTPFQPQHSRGVIFFSWRKGRANDSSISLSGGNRALSFEKTGGITSHYGKIE